LVEQLSICQEQEGSLADLFITFHLSLKEGDLCVVNQEQHPYCGRIVRFKGLEYAMQLPLYVFESFEQERVVVSYESHFDSLPYDTSLLDVIDLALQTRDEMWFYELVYKLRYLSQKAHTLS
jgi:hypothetical protein